VCKNSYHTKLLSPEVETTCLLSYRIKFNGQSLENNCLDCCTITCFVQYIVLACLASELQPTVLFNLNGPSDVNKFSS
jgi:hypothetical protein